MQNFKINARVCIYSLADINVCHCAELIIFQGKPGEFLVIRVLKSSKELKNDSHLICFLTFIFTFKF